MYLINGTYYLLIAEGLNPICSFSQVMPSYSALQAEQMFIIGQPFSGALRPLALGRIIQTIQSSSMEPIFLMLYRTQAMQIFSKRQMVNGGE